MGRDTMSTRKIALTAIFSALALIISLFESLLPPIIPVLPFAKVGISHIIIIASILLIGTPEALIVLLVRTFFAALFQGNPSALLYSMPAGLISLLLMYLLLKSDLFGAPAISALSGAMHNLIQILVAAIITNSVAVFVYLPYLMLFGSAAGLITGIISAILIKKLPENLLYS